MPGSNDNNLPRQINKTNSDTLMLETCLFIMSVEKTEKTANNKYTTHQYRLAAPMSQEQVICHGKANQKYRLILVFKPFLLVSMIQRLSKKLGNSTTLEIMDFVPRL